MFDNREKCIKIVEIFDLGNSKTLLKDEYFHSFIGTLYTMTPEVFIME